MRTKKELIEDIEHYTKEAEDCTKWAEYHTLVNGIVCSKWAEYYTKKAEDFTKWAEEARNELKELEEQAK